MFAAFPISNLLVIQTSDVERAVICDLDVHAPELATAPNRE